MPHQNSPLLCLPAELRNQIYTSLFDLENKVEVPVAGRVTRPPLLKTCRSITEEASHLYYANSNFHATITPNNAADLISWLLSIGRKNSHAISEISISCDLSSATKLRCLEQQLRQAPPTPIADESMGVVSVQKDWEGFVARLLRLGVKASSVSLEVMDDGLEKYSHLDKYCISVYRFRQQQRFEADMLPRLKEAVEGEEVVERSEE